MLQDLAYSVLVCTHNRAEMLARSLPALLAEVAGVDLAGEVLVVDNASTDGTAALVQALMRHDPGGALRYLAEPVPGVARARNRAVEAAAGAILLFLDDDALVHPGWLRSCLSAFAAWPDADAVGGEILPRCAAGFPAWFRPPLTKIYSVMSLDGRLDGGPENPGWLRPVAGGGIRPYPGEEHPLGVNMAFRRAVFAERRFSPRLGRTGADLIGSEETEIFFALRAGGRLVLYVPEMRVDHEIAPARLSMDWAVRRSWSEGVSWARLHLGPTHLARDAALMGAKLAWLGATWAVPRSAWRRVLWRCRVAKSCGFFAELLGGAFHRQR